MNGTFVKRCGNLRELIAFIDGMKAHTKLKYFFFSVGCNDLDTKSGDQVFGGLKLVVEKLRDKFPGIKIILSEITPRMDNFDIQVKATNTLLNQYVDASDDLFITGNSNMRDPDFFMNNDNKHFNQACIARFAKNIKIALSQAYGIQQRHYKDTKGASMNNNGDVSTLSHTNGGPSQQMSTLDARGIINSFKACLLRTITDAFERAEF